MWKINLFKKKEDKQAVKEPSKEDIKFSALRKIKRIRFRKDAIHELSDALRDFFSEYFAIGYEFTVEELKDELEKKGIKRIVIESVRYVLDNLDNKKFYSEGIKKSEFIEIVEEVELVINII